VVEFLQEISEGSRDHVGAAAVRRSPIETLFHFQCRNANEPGVSVFVKILCHR